MPDDGAARLWNKQSVSFGQRLREERKRLGLSLDRLAEASGVSKTSLSNYENGKRAPGGDEVAKLAKVLEVTADYLLGAGPRDHAAAAAEQDARRWFLHRIEHETPARKALAERWLSEHAPPYTGRPVPWNNDLVDAFGAFWRAQHAPAVQVLPATERIVELDTDDSAFRRGLVRWLDGVPANRQATAAAWAATVRAAFKADDWSALRWADELAKAWNAERKGRSVAVHDDVRARGEARRTRLRDAGVLPPKR